jgi:hypothetical protein
VTASTAQERIERRGALHRLIERPELAAYVATTALALIPVWLPSVFPSQDGGAHMYNAHVLAMLLSGDAAHYSDIYSLNFTAVANWADHLLLALFTLLASPAIAEKLLVTTYVVAFAAAARYAVAAVRPDHAWVSHLALPLIFTFSVQMGFYNFILCFPLYFVLVGFYWRHRNGRPKGALALLLLTLYILHPLAWLFGVLTLTILVVANARDSHAHGHTSAATTARRALDVWIAATPGVVLLLVLIGNEPVDGAVWQPLPALLRHVFYGGPLWTFSPVDTALGAALFGLFAFGTGLAWKTARSGEASHALAWATGAYVLLLLILPSQWKSLGLITERIGTFAFLTWVLALAGHNYPPRARRALIIGAQALALLLVARWTVAVQALEPYLEEYLSVATHLEPSRRVLELNFAPRGRGPEGDRLSHPVAPFAHTIGLVGASRNAVILNDYEALTAVFPLKYRSDAGDLLESTLHDPPDFRIDDLEDFERSTCRPIDYVVVWQPDPDDPHTREMLSSLRDRYALVYVSEPGGRAQVHRRQGAGPCEETTP